MLHEFGSERLIGMLHAYLLLKPVITKALRKKEEIMIVDAKLTETKPNLDMSQSD